MNVDVKNIARLAQERPLEKLEENKISEWAAPIGRPRILHYWLGIGGEEEMARKIREKAPENANRYVLGDLTTSRDFYGRDNAAQAVQYYEV